MNKRKIKIPANSQIMPVIRLLPVNLKIASHSHQCTGKIKKRIDLVTNLSPASCFYEHKLLTGPAMLKQSDQS